MDESADKIFKMIARLPYAHSDKLRMILKFMSIYASEDKRAQEVIKEFEKDSLSGIGMNILKVEINE